MDFLYFDCEYRDREIPEELVLLSWMTSTEPTPKTIDLRSQEGRRQVIALTESYSDHAWVAYNAQADLACLLALGVDITLLRVIDAMAEARMVTLTHQDHWSPSQSLLASLEAFGIQSEIEAHQKDATRDLILATDVYSDAEWSLIVAYGPTDITPLPVLMRAISHTHQIVGSPVSVPEMLERGEYVKAVTVLSFRSHGFPVDEDHMREMYGNSEQIRHRLIEKAVHTYGPIYWNDYTWSQEGFRELVCAKGYSWERTESGKLKLADDYLKAQSKRYPELQLLYQIRKLCSALRSTDLRDLITPAGYIKPPVFTFSQKTGRNSPKPSKGFLLNLPPWMRSVIRPKSGMVFVGADWAQQEIAIGAVLSGDDNLLAAYNNPDGDVYLALAKMAGAVPPDATKQSHPLERQTFKAIQLGLGYGKGANSLALDVYEANCNSNGKHLLSMEEAQYRAETIYEWHQDYFQQYWDWLRDSVDQARTDEYLRSVDGWTYFVGDDVRDTQLLNFPLQSAGAAMMRRATIHIHNAGMLDLVCSLHDAFYINCQIQQQDEHVRTLVRCMDSACQDILGDKVKIPVDVHVYDAVTGYQDLRANAINQILNEVLD